MTSRTSIDPNINSTGRTWLIFAGIILIAINLRAAITSVGPLIGIIREDTGISNTLAGMLTTLPLLAFALLSPMAPAMAKNGAGDNPSAEYGRADFWHRHTLDIVSLYAVDRYRIPRDGHSRRERAAPESGQAGLPAPYRFDDRHLLRLDEPARRDCIGGQHSAGYPSRAWLAGLPVNLGILVHIGDDRMADPAPQFRKTAEVSSAAGKQQSVLKSPLAWYITLFMGLQSFTFYVNISWLPEILRSQGMDYSAAGWMLSILQFVSLPFSFIIPVLAGRNPNQRLLVTISALSMLTGYAGLLSGMSSLNLLWVMLVGISGGANFSLSLMFFTLRTKTADEAAALSGMAQSLGYLLAAVGPMLIGFLHDATGGWKVPLTVLSAVVVVLFVLV